MKKLILVRHAKSSWDDSATPDKERPLNERGRAAAPKIGKWLAAHGHQPDQVLCSTAKRCRETWDGISPALNPVADVRYEDLLYLASDQEMLEALQAADGDTILMIGHMPGIGNFVNELRQDPPPLHGLFSKYPTGGTTVLEFNIDDWVNTTFGIARHADYVTPRDL